MIIPILFEPNFAENSIWCDSIRQGIESYAQEKKYATMIIDGQNYREYDYNRFFENEPRIVLLVSSSPAWGENALRFFEKEQIAVVLCDCFNAESSAIKARVHFDYKGLFKLISRHLDECGCKQIALYGFFIHSTSDQLKLQYFREESQRRGITDTEGLCFENKSNLDSCYEIFRKHIRDFDAVICVNSLAAVSLVDHLKKDNIRIPDDIQIISCGDCNLCRHICPSITSVVGLDSTAGCQAVKAYKYCYSSGNVPLVMNLLLQGELIQRASTKPKYTSLVSDRKDPFDLPKPTRESLQINFYNDSMIRSLSNLEKLLTCCDDIDIRMLKMFLDNMPYDQMSENLYISRGSIFYRLKRIASNFSIRTYAELKTFLIENRFLDFINDI